jgi:hypothetical protein
MGCVLVMIMMSMSVFHDDLLSREPPRQAWQGSQPAEALRAVTFHPPMI